MPKHLIGCVTSDSEAQWSRLRRGGKFSKTGELASSDVLCLDNNGFEIPASKPTFERCQLAFSRLACYPRLKDYTSRMKEWNSGRPLESAEAW